MVDNTGLCCECRFWKSHETATESSDAGECRRYAPRPHFPSEEREQLEWPTTDHDDWCGEWQDKDSAKPAGEP